MTSPSGRLRRALLSALAGGGLTAAGLAGPLAPATAAEATGTTTAETPAVAPQPTTSETTPSPPPANTTSTANQGTPPPSTTTTASTAEPPPPPTVTRQHPQKKTGTQEEEQAGGALQGKTGGTPTGVPPASEPAPVAAAPRAPLSAPSNVAPAPQLIAGQSAAPALLLAGAGASNQTLQFFQVPLFLLPIYQSAAIQYGVPWEILAAINEVETDYGTDLSVSSAGAVGWMQFMPETWLQYGVDALDAGYADPYNPVDAIFAAARYLRAAGAAKDLRGAIFAYNHSDAYVTSVLLRARLLASYPPPVIATLTGLTEGRLPVPGAPLPAPASAASEPPPPSASATANAAAVAPPPPASIPAGRQPLQLLDLSGPAGAPVVAVEDGRVTRIGYSSKLGKYLRLRDVYGDIFTYAGLGSLVTSYRLPASNATVPKSAKAGAETAADAKPKRAASAGAHPRGAVRQAPAVEPEAPAEQQPAPSGSGKVRLFANPQNPYAVAAAARAQRTVSVDANGNRWEPLRRGSVLTQGTVLGHLDTPPTGRDGTLRFAIQPAGDSGSVDALPILENWRQLGRALHPKGSKGNRGLIGATANDAFLLTQGELERTVLSDPGIDIYPCGRRDIAAGKIEKPVLAALLFLSRNGLKPTVSALRCGQSELTAAGAISTHHAGAAVDITAINGTPVAHHQGAGSVTDLAIRTLLTLQGKFAPTKIISRMKYPGSASTVARADHSSFIEVQFLPARSVLAPNPAAAAQVASKRTGSLADRGRLSSAGWQRLIERIGGLPAPKVQVKPSAAAIRDPQAAGANKDLGTRSLPLHKN